MAQDRTIFDPLFREMAHDKLDDALDLYKNGAPLWINTGCSFSSTETEGVRVEIWLKDVV